MNSYAILDIETAPDPTRMDLPIPDTALNKGVRDNFKQATVEEYQARNRSEWTADLYSRGSLDPFFGRIVALGFMLDGHHPDVTDTLNTKESEMLNYFWHMISTVDHVIGYGLYGFDWEWLYMRSAVHGLEPSKWWDPSPWTRHGLIDLQVLLNNGVKPKLGRTLEGVAEFFNLDHRPIGKGADVPRWVEEGNWDAITEHLEADLLTTHDLFRRIGPTYLGWPLTLEALHEDA